MRPSPAPPQRWPAGISIHAPLAGCDPRLDADRRAQRFQSTHPLRGATRRGLVFWCPASIFQSTHPLRGATLIRQVPRVVEQISIHAPLAGCDRLRTFGYRQPLGFQSTHPLRGATLCFVDLPGLELISIHAPLAGCDLPPSTRSPEMQISIHAPLAGCDVVTATEPSEYLDFNPRTPCGVRQQNCRNIHGKFAKKLQNFCKAKQRAALPRVGQRESGRYFRPCAVRTSQQDSERFRFASDNERALRSVTRLCAEVLDAGFILVSKVIKA